MYSVVVAVAVTPGMLVEYDAYSERFLEHCKQVPGLLSVFQEEDLSHPGRYIVAITLESRQAAQVWFRSPALKAIVQETPPGVFTIVGDVEAWETVVSTTPSGAASPSFNAITLFTISTKAGTSDAFETRGREVVALFEKHGRGLAFASLVRLAGSVTRYALSLAFQTAEDARATFAVPEIVRLWSEDVMRPYLVGDYEVQRHATVRSMVVQPATAG